MKLLASAVLTAVTAVACGTPPPASRTEPPQATVTIARAQSEQVPSSFEAGGVVRARLTAAVASRLLAPVVEVRVRPGDRVTAGQTLVTLDAREMEAQAARAAAALAAARQSVKAAESDKLAADAGLTLATTSFERVNGLHSRKSATGQELDEATASLQAARGRASGAEAHVAEASAALTAAESASAAAAIAASYAVITAPFAGRITERFVDPGAMATPGTPLLTVEDTAQFRLEVSLDESRAGQVAVGQPVSVSEDGASPDAWHQGRVSEIARLDSAQHSFIVKIDMPSPVSARSGAFGRARFTTGGHQAVTAPASAVIRRGQMTFVFTVDRDGLAHLRPVTTGPPAAGRVELLAGVADGEPVVDNPPPALTDGTRVTHGAAR